MSRSSQPDTSLYDHFLWDAVSSPVENERLAVLAGRICEDDPKTRNVACSAIFYPYSGLKNTIKIEPDLIRIRVSDILRDAPDAILESLIRILIARALRRSPRTQWLEQVQSYLQTPEIEAQHAKTRRARTHKKLSIPQGKFYDLDAVFERINQSYFKGALPKPNLSWSPRRSRRQLGYHDSHFNLVVISRYLDRRCVPNYVVDYIMYHELLHTIIRSEHRSGRRIVHSPEFRRREQEFAEYEQALRWLQEAK